MARKHGKFGGVDDLDREEIFRWILFDNHKISSYLASYLFLRAFNPSAPDPHVLGWLRLRIASSLEILDRHLSTQDYVVGTSLSIAALSACGYLMYPKEETGFDLGADFEHVHRWLSRIKATAGGADPYEILPGQRIAPRWIGVANAA